jgi:pimeloyl-ACP methyl ester carboxylesterase
LSFVLIPGAGGMAWYWRRVLPLLRDGQHEAVAVDLPAEDEGKGLDDYAELVVEAIGERTDVVLVAQSLGGFTAPLVCARRRVRGPIFVNAMIPKPGETAGEWFGNTAAADAREEAARAGGYSAEVDLPTYFLHDVPEGVLRAGPSAQRPQSEAIFSQACRFERWPAAPLHVIASAHDRFFPVELQRRIARERLGLEPETVPGGHLVALANPRGLADLLLRLAQARRDP